MHGTVQAEGGGQLSLQHQRQLTTRQRSQQPKQPHHLAHIGLWLTVKQGADTYGLAICIPEGDPGISLRLPFLRKGNVGKELEQTIAKPGFPPPAR